MIGRPPPRAESHHVSESALSVWRNLPQLVGLTARVDLAGSLLLAFLLVFDGVLPIALIASLQHFVDATVAVIRRHGGMELALLWLGAVFVITFATHLVSVAGQSVALYLNEEFKIYAQKLLLQKASRLSLATFEQPAFYDRLQRAQIGIDSHLVWIANNLPMVIINVLTTFALLAYVGSVNLYFPLLLTLGTIPVMIIDARYGNRRWRLSRAQTAPERMLDYFDDLMTSRNSAAEIRLFGLQDYLLDRRQELFRPLSRQRTDLARSALLKSVLGQLHVPLTLLVIASAVTVMAMQGRLSVGYFAAYILAVGQFTSAVWQSLSSGTRLGNELRYVNDIFDYLDIVEPPSPSEDSAAASVIMPGPRPVTPRVRLEDVSFSYPGSAPRVVDRITLEVQPGECVALVGENGAGKSTLVNLALGLYAPSSGRILVDGIDMAEMGLFKWRPWTAAVIQDYMRYELTPRENIGFGDLARLDELPAIRLAATQSGIDCVIEQLPQGYETVLGRSFGTDGQDLSVGQWQKLAIARSYLRDAPFVVLDEPTAALDAVAEADVYRQFQRVAAGKSVLLISHRLGSTRIADRIVVLDHGRIVEQGTHRDLVARGGRYARMFAIQAEWYR